MKVLLTYFKPNGKYYSDGMYQQTVYKPLNEIWEDVERMRELGKLPGLTRGSTEFIIQVHVPAHPHSHPKLILPKFMLMALAEFIGKDRT